jgi:ABC-type multidrug transport system fused ATPase/permease subunit
LNDSYREANHSSNIYEAALFSLVETMSAISFALIIWYGGGQILAGALAFGTLVAFIEYIQKFFIPIRDFSTKYAVMQSAMSAAERVFQLLDTPVEIANPPRPFVPQQVRGKIEFEGVWFAYRGDDYVLRDLSFTVEPGEKVAFVGPTGSGKTTIMKLLNRSYDVSRGRVLVDGVDVRAWDLTVLRRHIGVVLQDVFLFSGTIASNLTLESPLVSEEAAVRAARTVHADHFIERLSEKYDEPVRERGNNLSTGQRQLLSFARDPSARRGNVERRHGDGAPDSRCTAQSLARTNRDRHRSSTVDDRACRSHSRRSRWRAARERYARGAHGGPGGVLPALSTAVREGLETGAA